MPKIIYILGYGRSGSTLLSMLLNRHPDIFSAGELINLTTNGWLKNRKCSCQQRAHDCPFWTQVMTEWLRASPVSDPVEYSSFAQQFRNYRLLPLLQKNPLSILPARDRQRFADATYALYETISRISGKSIICDTSKTAAWFRILNEAAGLDTRPVHLIRDGKAVVWSLEKTHVKRNSDSKIGPNKQSRILVNAWKWILANMLCEYTARRFSKYRCLVRYEDLFSDAASFMNHILDQLGLNDHKLDAATLSAHTASHVIAGNKSRASGDLTLREDTEWKKHFNTLSRVSFCAGTCCMGIRYGYMP